MDKETHKKADDLRAEIEAMKLIAEVAACTTGLTAYDGCGAQVAVTSNFILDRFNDIVREELKRLRAEYAAL